MGAEAHQGQDGGRPAARQGRPDRLLPAIGLPGEGSNREAYCSRAAGVRVKLVELVAKLW